MQFVLSNWDEAVAAVAGRLERELAQGKVLWLISGGSQTAYNVKIMQQLPAELSQRLTIMPIDERYGPPGHPDSNWAQLLNVGFDAKQAKTLPVLKDGLDFNETLRRYQQTTAQAFQTDFILATLGIGEDGHTAGILPGSPACQSNELAAGYQAEPYQRLTLTFPALKRINAAYALAFGASKKSALERLKTQDLPLAEQPAQILKQLPQAYIYNDQLGDA